MRLIDADALMDALGIAVECKDCSRNGTFGCKEDSTFVYACEAITDAPTIDPTVLCGMCRYWDSESHYCALRPSIEPWWEEDYCSYGERRGEDDEESEEDDE